MNETSSLRYGRSMAVVAIFAGACAPALSDPARPGAITPFASREEIDAVLAFVNHESTSRTKLDDIVGLDAQAAALLVERRDGPDGRCSTSDDRPFVSLGDLYSVPWLGPDGLDNLISWAIAEGWPGVRDPHLGTFDGVSFTVLEAEATLAIVHEFTGEELASGFELHPRAIASILDARPFSDLADLADTWFVGENTLRTLRDGARPL